MINLNSLNSLSGFVAATTIAIITLLTFVWLRQRHTFWRRHHVPFVESTLLLGNLMELLKLRTSFGDFFRQLYDSGAAMGAPVVGVYWFQTPALVIRDTELIRKIFIKDSNQFLNRYESADALHDRWGALTLPLAKYPIWRESRKRMAEFFTSGQTKQRMYPLMLELCLQLEQHIEQHLSTHKNSALIEVKELCALFTTDVTTLLAFSIRAGSLNGQLRIRQGVKDLLEPNPLKAFNFFLHFFLPRWTSWLHAKVFPSNYMEFISKMLAENLKARQMNLYINSNGDDYRDDLIDILLRFQNEMRQRKNFEFTNNSDFLAAQVAIMLIAGFETSSSLMAFILYELAKQPSVQHQLRQELWQHFRKANNVRKALEYEELQSLKYLNMVVAEGLRMYPSAAFINREYTPLDVAHSKGYSLRPFVDFEMPPGMPAYVSILGLHRDEKHWPNPNHFEPARFAPERLEFILPMTYIPFGAGPHGCIGSRLGVLQVKLGLAHILKDFRVEFCTSTPKQIIFDPKSFMLQNKDGIDLRFVKIIHFGSN